MQTERRSKSEVRRAQRLEVFYAAGRGFVGDQQRIEGKTQFSGAIFQAIGGSLSRCRGQSLDARSSKRLKPTGWYSKGSFIEPLLTAVEQKRGECVCVSACLCER